jgi:hypothetical protein
VVNNQTPERATSVPGTMLTMQNPWSELPAQSPYILEMDWDSIKRYNQSVYKDEKKVIVESIPEPFIGNPQSAKLLLLNLNPGHSEDDRKAHSDKDFRRAMIHNLRREPQECPFYALNPRFAWTACGQWWRAHTESLHEAGLSWEAISAGLLVIEWFPYHSKSSALPSKPVCPSQEYSFQLAREMLGSKIAVRMRSKKHWLAVDDRVQEVPFLKNPQNPHISVENMGKVLFDRVVSALQ